VAQPAHVAVPWWRCDLPAVKCDWGNGGLEATAAEALPAVWQGSNQDPVLVGDDSDDLVIGQQGCDVLVGGVGNSSLSALAEMA
jgi:Ca2+-binding RTX toxin-like protein